MISENQALMDLIEKGKRKGYVSIAELLKYVSQDSEDYDEVVRLLEAENVDLMKEDMSGLSDEDPDKMGDDFEGFIGDLESDPEFNEFTSKIEQELKSKDIDDLISSTTTVKADDPIKMYLKEIGQIPLLNAQRELELARSIQMGLSAEAAMKAIESGKKKATEEEIEKLKDYIQDGQDSFDILTESNLRLVVSIAKKFLGRGMQLQDLIQEGNMGLMKAAKKFDPTRGFKFSTYATWWIKQSITRAIADQARTIRIPVHMVDTINKLVRTQRKLTQELRRDPKPQEIAAEMGITVKEVYQIQTIAQEPVSLEKPVGEEDDSTLGDFVHDHDMPNPLDYTMNEKFKEEIDAVLKTLTPREEQVIRLRYGFGDGKPKTLEEVGKEFNVTRERIRQIEAKAIRRLRHPTRQKKLSKYRTN